MKNILKFSPLLLFILILFAGCGKDKLDKNGLTKDINNIVPDYIIDIMKELGMPIYGGDNPPMLTDGSYMMSPDILMASTISYDIIGKEYNDVFYTFSEQDNKKLTLFLRKYQTNLGEGYGSYIVGKDNQFSVFAEVITHKNNGYVTKHVQVCSGKKVNGGIEDLHTALFMVDNDGDPDVIANGEGRVFYDKDGFSELIDYYSFRINIENQGLPLEISK
ncbi:MAG: hypothetical protein M9887_02025 [Chitinophagales bacterium]|nr:hypothetical protein [Chitinophagales bacterium]